MASMAQLPLLLVNRSGDGVVKCKPSLMDLHARHQMLHA